MGILNRKTLLIIDDTYEIREILSEALMNENFETITAVNGREALDLLLTLQASDYPDLIILDIMMPVMNGHEFLSEIHSNHKDTLAKIPLIVASAKTKFELSLPEGITFLRKPIDLDELYELINKMCSPRD